MVRESLSLILGVVATFLAASHPAGAGELAMPIKAAAQPSYDWTGMYFGGHFGYGGGSLGAGTNPQLDEGVIFPPPSPGSWAVIRPAGTFSAPIISCWAPK